MFVLGGNGGGGPRGFGGCCLLCEMGFGSPFWVAMSALAVQFPDHHAHDRGREGQLKDRQAARGRVLVHRCSVDRVDHGVGRPARHRWHLPISAVAALVGSSGPARGRGGGVGIASLLPALEERPHAYTAFLAAMLLVYGVTSQLNGSGAVAVLTAALLLGNASSLVPQVYPRCRRAGVRDRPERAPCRDQMSFFVKSFFFVLIGLMFPTSPRLTLLGALPCCSCWRRASPPSGSRPSALVCRRSNPGF